MNARSVAGWTFRAAKAALAVAVLGGFGLGAGAGAVAAETASSVRVALVIGNSAYAGAPLANPSNDAKTMGDALRGLGFSVVEMHDASKAQMVGALDEAARLLKGKNGVGMLYYAGHGLQLDWHNYMLPVDVRIAKVGDVREQGVDVQAVIDAFRGAGNRVNIIVLDACRDNPFEDSTGTKGLAPMDAPSGTFLAFATAPGNVADDGEAGAANGLYTGFLLREMTKPRARIEDVFKRVRLQVRERSMSRQVPWESTSLEEEFVFDSGVRKIERTSASQVNEDFELERAEWSLVADSKDPLDLYDFLQRHPTGYLSEKAEFRLDQLEHPDVQVEKAADGIDRLPSGVARYATGDTFNWEVTDGFTGTKKRQLEAVIAADDRKVLFTNGNVFDQMGGIATHGKGVADPPIMQAPADIAVGKKWRTAFVNKARDGTVTRNQWDFKVVGIEEIKTPAGTFKAFKVEGRGEASTVGGSGYTTLQSTGWIDPATMIQVRLESLFRFNGRISDWQTIELVAMKRMPR